MTRRLPLMLGVTLALGACGDIDVGGGGDVAKLVFNRGYVFVRDANIYVADAADYDVAKPLTTSNAAASPAISRNGKVIAYLDSSGGYASLRRVSSDGSGDAEIVAGRADRTLLQPAVSPDGQTVVFVAATAGGQTGKLYLVNADGSNERAVPLSDNDCTPSFGPSGTTVFVLTGGAIQPDQVVETVLAGGRLTWQSLTDLGVRAAVSPDGTRVAVERKVGGRTKIFVVSASGSPQQLADTGGNERYPTWSGASRVGFVSDAGGGTHIYENDISGGGAGSYQIAVPAGDQCAYGGN